MIERVVVKFIVSTVEKQGYKDHESKKPVISGEKINASPVYVPKDAKVKDSENWQFFNATPSGQLWLQINNPGAFGFFEPGEEVYATFSRKSPLMPDDESAQD